MEHQQSFHSPINDVGVGVVVELGINDGMEVLGVNDDLIVVATDVGSAVGSKVGGKAGAKLGTSNGLLVGNVDGRKDGATTGAIDDGRVLGRIDGSDIKVTYPHIFVETSRDNIGTS